MKPFSLLTLLVVALLYTGCTDHLAGPDLDSSSAAPSSLEQTASRGDIASRGGSGKGADLALRMSFKPSLAPTLHDSLYWIVEIHNEGPALTTGVETTVQVGCDCFDEDGTLHGRLDASAGDIYEDSFAIVWQLDAMPSGATERLLLVSHAMSTGPFTSTAEITASAVRDPDSVPGDGDPRQDDYASVTVLVGSEPSP